MTSYLNYQKVHYYFIFTEGTYFLWLLKEGILKAANKYLQDKVMKD